jgi:hypothetical protein
VAPEEIQKKIFNILLTFFEACETPDQRKQVILYLIQKDLLKLPLPANFRPVGLLEVLHKVWTKMIFAQITPIINHGEVLQPNHYAFLPCKGTGSELIQILNLLEEVVEHGLLVDLSTLDVLGAFDSPERTAQYICWRRVGIPAPLATYLVSLAALSTYKISSPYGIRKPDLPEDDVIPELNNRFLPARGCSRVHHGLGSVF